MGICVFTQYGIRAFVHIIRVVAYRCAVITLYTNDPGTFSSRAPLSDTASDAYGAERDGRTPSNMWAKTRPRGVQLGY